MFFRSIVVLLPWLVLALCCSRADCASAKPFGGTGAAGTGSVTLTGDGSLSISWESTQFAVKNATCAATVNGLRISARQYPNRSTRQTSIDGPLGTGERIETVFSGIPEVPDLVWSVQRFADKPFVILDLEVRNNSDRPVTLSELGILVADPGGLDLGEAAGYRVLSETASSTNKVDKTLFFNDDRREISSTWLQMVQNPESGGAFLAANLSADRFASYIKIAKDGGKLSLEAVNGGTDFTGSQPLKLELSPGEFI